jgi:hypothetical protein
VPIIQNLTGGKFLSHASGKSEIEQLFTLIVLFPMIFWCLIGRLFGVLSYLIAWGIYFLLAIMVAKKKKNISFLLFSMLLFVLLFLNIKSCVYSLRPNNWSP